MAFNAMWMLLICSVVWHLVELPWFVWPAIVVFSAVLAFFLILGTTFAVEPLVRVLAGSGIIEDRARAHGAILHVVLAALAIAGAFDSHWIRWPASAWLGLIALEWLAASIEHLWSRRREEPSAD